VAIVFNTLHGSLAAAKRIFGQYPKFIIEELNDVLVA
jgi:hypothetical protein